MTTPAKHPDIGPAPTTEDPSDDSEHDMAEADTANGERPPPEDRKMG
jgi:hypothetical protein